MVLRRCGGGPRECRSVSGRHVLPAGTPPRPALATIRLRISVLASVSAGAVVGYTDALGATLFTQNGVPSSGGDLDHSDIERQLHVVEAELAAVLKHR